MTDSKLRRVSIGRAAENKALDSVYLEVVAIELTQFLDGEVLPNPTEVSSKGVDGENRAYDVKVTAANSLKARWLPMGTNRLTPPDVRRGERVHIYQYSDVDEYYWVSPGMDDNLRKLETVIFAISATADEKDTVLTPDNTYMLEVSSHNKTITLSTSKKNAEPFAYTVQLNLADGCFTITDDDDNFLELDSAEQRITLINKNESMVKLDKKEIFIHSADLIDIKTKVVNLTCETLNAKADTANIDFKQTNWKGNETREGDTTLTGNITQTGNYSVTGAVATTGSITNNGKNIGNGHTHGNGNNGSPTTGVL